MSKRAKLKTYKLLKWQNFLACVIAIALFLGISTTAISQEDSVNRDTEKAPVVLDGREIFKIGSLGNLTPTERANSVSQTLQNKAQFYADNPSKSLEVKIARQSDWTVLKLDNRHLITVAEQEIIPGMGIDEQALIWQEKIQSALKRAIEERSSQYRIGAIKAILVALLLGIMAGIGLFFLKRRYRRKLLNANKKRHSWTILSISVLQISIWIVLIYYGANLFPSTRQGLYLTFDFLNSNFNAEIIQVGEETAISLRHIVMSILLGIGWWFLVTWLAKFLQLRIVPLTELEDTLQSSIVFITRYGLLFIGLLLILNFGGIDFRSLALIISALGVGIGFGLQNIVKDFVSGVILALTRPIKIGELIEVGESKGLILRIGARTTDISHVDRHILTVPNSRFIEETVKNWNRSGLNRVKVYVNVAYNSDRELVYKTLLSAAQVYHPDILKHPPPKVKFRNFSEGSLLFRVVVFIKDPLKEPKVRNHIQLNIDKNFRKYGIEIPFPQRDIHFKVPQLDELVANLTTQYKPTQTEIYQPNKPAAKKNTVALPTSEELTIQEEYNWQELIATMRGIDGLEIKDRRYGLKTYHKVFSGTEAVNWLIEREKATRTEAIEIGKMMVKQRIIHHVLNEHDFKDEPLFYRFYLDELNQNQDLDWESDDDM